VITIITLKYRKRNDDREKGNSQNEDALSEEPNWVKFFDSNRPTLYRGSRTFEDMVVVVDSVVVGLVDLVVVGVVDPVVVCVVDPVVVGLVLDSVVI
jgi:hypothetical protein